MDPFGDDSQKRFVVGRFLENPGPSISSIQGMIQPARLISSCCTRHGISIATAQSVINES